jgi:hypothetical protein
VGSQVGCSAGEALGDANVNDATRHNVSIITHDAGTAEIPWVRFLLGEWAGPVVVDPDHEQVVPDSLVVCDRLDHLGSPFLSEVRKVATVGLLHTGDRRYRARLVAYPSFAWVWRTYHHTALTDLALRQLPLGPAAFPVVTADPTPAALRRPVERRHTWSFVGDLTASSTAMLDAFLPIEGGQYDVVSALPTNGSGPPAGAGAGSSGAGAGAGGQSELALLADSVFAPCPMGRVHLESARIYDALEVGAIPVVERRRWLDYFTELLGDHPLPTARSWVDAADYARRMLADPQALVALQNEVLTWWSTTKRTLAAAAQADVAETVDDSGVAPTWTDGPPLDRPAPRWRNRIETLRHHDMPALRARLHRRPH